MSAATQTKAATVTLVKGNAVFNKTTKNFHRYDIKAKGFTGTVYVALGSVGDDENPPEAIPVTLSIPSGDE